jgi:hypothetical protein
MTELSFQRGRDPKHMMGIGQKAIIQNWLDEMGIENYTINDDLKIDIDGSVSFNEKMEGFPPNIRFNKVTGSFFCRRCGLTTLEGSPKQVGELFDCSGNNLSSIKGGPEKVGSFVCFNILFLFAAASFKSNKYYPVSAS